MEKFSYLLNSISLKNLNFILFLLIPISFIIGAAAVNIILFLISISFITKIIIEKKIYSFFQDITFKFFIFFLIYAYLTTIFNYEKLYFSELFKIISYLKYIILYFFISDIYLNLEKNRKTLFLKFNFTLLILFSLDLFFQYLTGTNVLGFEQGMCYKGNNYFDFKSLSVVYDEGYICQRMAGLFDQEFIAGSFLLVFGSIFVFLYNTKKNNFLLFLSINILIFLILITGDRTPFLLIITSIFLFLIKNLELRRYFLIWISFPIVIFFILMLSNPQLFVRYTYVYDKIIDKVYFLNNQSEKSEIINTNKEIKNLVKKVIDNFYKTPWGAHVVVSKELIKDSPVFGHGLKTFRKKCNEYSRNMDIENKSIACSTHPHNLYLEFLIDFGFIGLIIFILMILSIFFKKDALQKIHKDPMLLYLICLLIMIFFPLKPSGSFFSTITGTLFFYLLGWIKFSLDNQTKKIK